MFTKKDLKNGDFVVLQDYSVGVVVKGLNNIVYQNGTHSIISEGLKEDLTSECLEIMLVYRPIENYQGSFDTYCLGKLVFDRSRDCIKEMTLEQISKELGYNVKIVKGE